MAASDKRWWKLKAKAEKLAAKGKIDEAVRVYNEMGCQLDAARLLEDSGRLREAATIFQKHEQGGNAARCLLKLGLEDEALAVLPGAYPPPGAKYYSTTRASKVWRNYIYGLSSSDKTHALQCMLKASIRLCPTHWQELLKHFGNNISNPTQQELWAEILLTDAKRDDYGLGQPNRRLAWQEVIAFFKAGNEDRAFKIFKENMAYWSDSDGHFQQGVRSAPHDDENADPAMPALLELLIGGGLLPDSGFSARTLDSLANIACDVDREGQTAWSLLPPEIPRGLIKALCNDWFNWLAPNFQDSDGKSFTTEESVRLGMMNAFWQCMHLYECLGREDPKVEATVVAFAEKQGRHDLVRGYLEARKTYRKAIDYICSAPPVSVFQDCVLPDGRSLVTDPRACEAAAIATCCGLYAKLDTKSPDPDVERGIISRAEELERYDLALTALERFGRLEDAIAYLGEVPPSAMWPESASPERDSRNYREKLVFKLKRTDQAKRPQARTKSDLDRMLALGEVTAAEHDRMISQLNEEGHETVEGERDVQG